MKFCAALAFFTLLSSIPDSAICGNLYFLQDWWSEYGLYQLDPSSGKATAVYIPTGGTDNNTGLSEGANPEFLHFGSSSSSLKSVPLFWGKTNVIGGAHAEGLGYDPDSKILYGSMSSGDFYTISMETGAKLVDLTSPPNPVLGLAVLDGIVYGMEGRGGGRLLSYNPVANTWITVGSTGLSFMTPGLAADPDRKILYAIGVDGSNVLYKIDPDTAVATPIGPTGVNSKGGGLAYVAFSKPDVSVSIGSSVTIGEGVFQPTNQTVRVRRKHARARVVSRIRITSTDRNDIFLLNVGYSAPGLKGLDIRTKEGKKIGANVFGPRRTPLLEAGESTEIYAIFRFFRPRRAGRHRIQFRITAKSSGDSSLYDSARLLILPPRFVKSRPNSSLSDRPPPPRLFPNPY